MIIKEFISNNSALPTISIVVVIIFLSLQFMSRFLGPYYCVKDDWELRAEWPQADFTSYCAAHPLDSPPLTGLLKRGKLALLLLYHKEQLCCGNSSINNRLSKGEKCLLSQTYSLHGERQSNFLRAKRERRSPSYHLSGPAQVSPSSCGPQAITIIKEKTTYVIIPFFYLPL